MCLFFVPSFIGDNNFQNGRFGLNFFLKKVLLSEYSTDYVSSSYMYLINILL